MHNSFLCGWSKLQVTDIGKGVPFFCFIKWQLNKKKVKWMSFRRSLFSYLIRNHLNQWVIRIVGGPASQFMQMWSNFVTFKYRGVCAPLNPSITRLIWVSVSCLPSLCNIVFNISFPDSSVISLISIKFSGGSVRLSTSKHPIFSSGNVVSIILTKGGSFLGNQFNLKTQWSYVKGNVTFSKNFWGSRLKCFNFLSFLYFLNVHSKITL